MSWAMDLYRSKSASAFGGAQVTIAVRTHGQRTSISKFSFARKKRERASGRPRARAPGAVAAARALAAHVALRGPRMGAARRPGVEGARRSDGSRVRSDARVVRCGL